MNEIVCYRMGDSELEDWDDSREIKTSTNDTTYTIEDLLPYTVYSFRVSAVNARGRSEPSRPSYYIITLREGIKPRITYPLLISSLMYPCHSFFIPTFFSLQLAIFICKWKHTIFFCPLLYNDRLCKCGLETSFGLTLSWGWI